MVCTILAVNSGHPDQMPRSGSALFVYVPQNLGNKLVIINNAQPEIFPLN